MQDAPRPPLAGLRVLEVGGGFALAYCGKLFADFGAAVTKAEPAGGDPLRRAAPLVEAGRGAESALFAWLSTNKRGVSAAPEAVAAHVAAADVLLDGRAPAERAAAPLGRDDPGLVACDLSWFGETGPYARFAGTDAVARALGGVLFCTGPAEGPPDILGGFPGETVAGLAAFVATAAALLGGGGRRVECNALEANLAVAEYHVAQAAMTPDQIRRIGRDRFFPTWPMGVYRCADGTFLGVTVVTPAQWRGFCAMLGLPDLGADPALALGPDRMARAAELEAVFAPRLLARTAAGWFEECLPRRLPIAVVPSMAALLATPQHRGRGAFSPVAIGRARFEGPTLPQRLSRTPPLPGGRAPFAGEHDADPPPPPPRARPGVRAGAGPPLDGVTVLDLSMGWAGPLCTRMLGDLGATVVKVEACAYPDWWRGVDPKPAFFAGKQYERNTRFNALNRNKLGVTLDLTAPEGVALLKRLAHRADAVVENYAREVLPKLGLDYPALSAERPDLVMVSMPAFGADGPWRDARAYGSTLEHASGLPGVAGEEGGPPVTSQLAYGDPVGGTNAAAAALVALLHRRRTGEGQHVDLAQVECMVQLAAPWLVAQSATGAPLPRLGSRHPEHVPEGCFACAGEEAWLVVAVQDDAAWRGLCAAIGRADLGTDPSLAAAAGRRAREAELEAAIAAWTRPRDPDAAMAALQAAGVAAGVCRSPARLDRDPHLIARGAFQPTERAFVGRHLQLSAPFRDAAGGPPLPVRRAAPTLGQDNAAVLGGLLGLDAAELARLEAAGVIGAAAVPVAARRARASTG